MDSLAIKNYMRAVGVKAREASRHMARADTAAKNRALNAMADALMHSTAQLVAENRKDLDNARASGLDSALIDRLTLNDKSIVAMADGLRQIADLPDPVGEITDLKYRPSGIQVGRMRVPLGVVGIIYESRPNVTADAAGLCLKSGNACILRGGSEAIHSNRAIAACVQAGLVAAGLPETAVQVVEITDRAAVGELITMKEFVDVIVPRGGKGLIERISNEAKIPVISTWMVSAMFISTTAPTSTRRLPSPTTPRRSATAPATPWRHCWSPRPSHPQCCRRSARSTRRRAWKCAAARRAAPFLNARV